MQKGHVCVRLWRFCVGTISSFGYLFIFCSHYFDQCVCESVRERGVGGRERI